MPDYTDATRYLGSQANHQKIYDFERDILRVRNPLKEDFEFVYDGLPIVIAGGGTKDMERYLVRRFIARMISHIYNQFASEKMATAEESFRRTHPDVMDDPYLLNTQIYDKMKRSDDPEFQKKIITDCIVGLVSKFGSNRMVPKTAQNGRLDPNEPLYQSLIDDFKTVLPATPTSTPSPTETPTVEQPVTPQTVLG